MVSCDSCGFVWFSVFVVVFRVCGGLGWVFGVCSGLWVVLCDTRGFEWFSLFVVVLGGFFYLWWFWVVFSVSGGFGWFSVLLVGLGCFEC